MCSLRLAVILATGKVFPLPQTTLSPPRACSLSTPLALGTPAPSLVSPGKEGTCKKSGELFGPFMAGEHESQEQPLTAGTGSRLSTYPELAAVAIVELQDVAFHLHRRQGGLLPGQGGTVVVGAALLQLQDRGGRHWGGS